MSPSWRKLLAALIVATVPGLSSCGKPHAVINDLGRVPARILDVDGRPVERAKSKFITVIPEAIVTPGLHTLRVRFETGSMGAAAETLSLSVKVDAGKRYEFTVRGGVLELIEESNNATATVEWQGHRLREVRALADLPAAIQSELGVGRPGTDGIADRGRPFNVTDVVRDNLPMRRFLVAGTEGDVWLVALERGGRAHSFEALLFSGAEATPKQKWALDRPKSLKEVVEQIPAAGGSSRSRGGL